MGVRHPEECVCDYCNRSRIAWLANQVADINARIRDIEKHLDDFNGYAPLPRKDP